MKPILELKSIIMPLSVLTLVVLIALSVACQKNDDPSAAASENQTAGAAPANTQSNSPSTVNPPNTNSATNNNDNASGPSIQITVVPSKGAGPETLETIAGTVSGVNLKECKVVVFARTNTWYVQPYIDASDTVINEDGTWRNDTHLGLQYAALLVKTSYKPPTTTGKLPPVGGLVLAVTTANARE